MSKKKKILVLCDHPLSTSGVGIQARYLINGLLQTGEYQFRCFGAAVKHADYRTVVVNEDFIIKPIDGFGDRNLLRQAISQERPDAIFLFTDPRFFIWVWEMEEEIHQICPIVYWHVWDNEPWPEFNRVLYESTDLVNCHSYLTYSMVKEHFPEKTNFIPHALTHEFFKPLPKEKVKKLKRDLLGEEKKDHFVGLWINRNAKRKRPNDVLEAWSLFLDRLEKEHGHRNATLIMHTDPTDNQGSNLLRTTEMLDLIPNIIFSNGRESFERIAELHNIADFCFNISMNEGFGLSTLEAMQCAKPIIAVKTGGLTRQVVDHRTGKENGIGLDVDVRSLVGSQLVPYIYEDYVKNENIADAIMKLYNWGPEERERKGNEARNYVLSEFNLENTVADWHRTLSDKITEWKTDKEKIYQPWKCCTL